VSAQVALFVQYLGTITEPTDGQQLDHDPVALDLQAPLQFWEPASAGSHWIFHQIDLPSLQYLDASCLDKILPQRWRIQGVTWLKPYSRLTEGKNF
jgi:hypothetical protein